MPTYDVGRVRHAMDLMHYSKASNGSSIPSNWIPAATGDSGIGWQPSPVGGSVSYGSNSSAVAEISIVGTLTDVARADHYHAGVNSITSSSSNTLQRGVVNLRAGSGIAFGDTDTDGDGEFDTLTISSTTSGGGGGGGTSGALVFLEAHTASSSATLDFTTAITSTYDDYVIEMVSIVPATNGAVPYFRFSTDGGSTYDTSTIYHWNMAYLHIIGGTDNGTHGANSVSRIELFEDGAGAAISSSGNLSASVRLFAPGNSSQDKYVTWMGLATYSSGTNAYQFQGGGAYASHTAVNAVRFLFSTGNVSSGTIRMYGISKS